MATVESILEIVHRIFSIFFSFLFFPPKIAKRLQILILLIEFFFFVSFNQFVLSIDCEGADDFGVFFISFLLKWIPFFWILFLLLLNFIIYFTWWASGQHSQRDQVRPGESARSFLRPNPHTEKRFSFVFLMEQFDRQKLVVYGLRSRKKSCKKKISKIRSVSFRKRGTSKLRRGKKNSVKLGKIEPKSPQISPR